MRTYVRVYVCTYMWDFLGGSGEMYSLEKVWPLGGGFHLIASKLSPMISLDGATIIHTHFSHPYTSASSFMATFVLATLCVHPYISYTF